MAKKQRNNLLAVGIIAVAIIVGFYVFADRIDLSIIQNFFQPDSQPQPPPDYQPPDYQPAANSLAPTSLAVIVSPNPVDMRSGVLGTVTSNGFNYPIEIEATFLGNGQKQYIPGFLGADGKFEVVNQMNIPGIYTFVAKANGVTSNTYTLTVRGIMTTVSDQFYSKAANNDVVLNCYSHYKWQTIKYYAINHNTMTETYFTTGSTNEYGMDFPSNVRMLLALLPNGLYEIQARIGVDSSGHPGWLASANIEVTP